MLRELKGVGQIIAAGRQGIEPKKLVGDLLGRGDSFALRGHGRLDVLGLGQDQPQIALGSGFPLGIVAD